MQPPVTHGPHPTNGATPARALRAQLERSAPRSHGRGGRPRWMTASPAPPETAGQQPRLVVGRATSTSTVGLGPPGLPTHSPSSPAWSDSRLHRKSVGFGGKQHADASKRPLKSFSINSSPSSFPFFLPLICWGKKIFLSSRLQYILDLADRLSTERSMPLCA